jgi:hypothetical protein
LTGTDVTDMMDVGAADCEDVAHAFERGCGSAGEPEDVGIVGCLLGARDRCVQKIAAAHTDCLREFDDLRWVGRATDDDRRAGLQPRQHAVAAIHTIGNLRREAD